MAQSTVSAHKPPSRLFFAFGIRTFGRLHSSALGVDFGPDQCTHRLGPAKNWSTSLGLFGLLTFGQLRVSVPNRQSESGLRVF